MSERTQSALTYTHPGVWLVMVVAFLVAMAALAIIVPLAMLAWLRDEVTKEPKRQSLGRIGLDDQGNIEKCTLTTLADIELTANKEPGEWPDQQIYAKSPQNESFCPLPAHDIQAVIQMDTGVDIAAILKQKPNKRKPQASSKKTTLAHQGSIDTRKRSRKTAGSTRKNAKVTR